MARGISLANKCQLLFGAAVVLIIVVALVLPWIRYGRLIDHTELETSRQIAKLWSANTVLEKRLVWLLGDTGEVRSARAGDLSIRFWTAEEWRDTNFDDGFLAAARRVIPLALTPPSGPTPEHTEATWDGGVRVYRCARTVADHNANVLGVVVVERRSASAAGHLMVNRLYLVISGLVAGVLAVLVFYFITTRIILSPVRTLRDTAELVREGNLHIRSGIKTGDEFEQLSDAFNSMLENLAAQQMQLRAINRSLDFKLTELAERNLALYEAARLKGEFLANVSHELRTPLNSIIGFAEILLDIAQRQTADDPDSPEALALVKRRRYLDNIANAGRSLLVMINELLDMAKIEAGRIELNIQPCNVAETCEGLLALIRPLADRKRITLELQLPSAHGGEFTANTAQSDLPPIHTDPQKFQQIIFNFLSNAVKFTPDGGHVTLRAERIIGGDGEARIHIAVLDTGPGIPLDQQDYIFEKFSQLDSGHTREHQGTGLGLAIAREFSQLLQGEVRLVSQPGRGSVFSLIVPLLLKPALRTDPAREDDSRAAHTSAGAD